MPHHRRQKKICTCLRSLHWQHFGRLLGPTNTLAMGRSYQLYGSLGYSEKDAARHKDSHALWELMRTGQRVTVRGQQVTGHAAAVNATYLTMALSVRPQLVEEDLPSPKGPDRVERGKLIVNAFMAQQTELLSSKTWRVKARESAKDALDASKRAEWLEKRVARLKVPVCGCGAPCDPTCTSRSCVPPSHTRLPPRRARRRRCKTSCKAQPTTWT